MGVKKTETDADIQSASFDENRYDRTRHRRTEETAFSNRVLNSELLTKIIKGTAMYSHVVVGTDDVQKAKTFYDAIFAFMELDEQGYDKMDRPFCRKGSQRFIITKPINGDAATFANGGTIGFEMPSAEAVYGWHKAGTELGGTSAESLPHVRPDGKCVAYLRDPTGNKICAFFQTAQ